MNVKDPMFHWAEDDEQVIEEFFVGEKNFAMLPMHNGDSELVQFTVIGCEFGDVTIVYDDGNNSERELSMSVEELTTAVSDA